MTLLRKRKNLLVRLNQKNILLFRDVTYLLTHFIPLASVFELSKEEAIQPLWCCRCYRPYGFVKVVRSTTEIRFPVYTRKDIEYRKRRQNHV